MVSSTPINQAERFFGDTVSENRDIKADLLALQTELRVYNIEQLADLSETEGSALREFADTIEREMNTPQDCLDLYEAVKTINTNWQTLTGQNADLPNDLKTKLLDCTRAIIVTQMQRKGMNIAIKQSSVSPAQIQITNPAATWTYPQGTNEAQFLTNIGLNTPAAAQATLNNAQHFSQLGAIMSANTPAAATSAAAGALNTINISSTPAAGSPASFSSSQPGVVTSAIRQIPWVGDAIADTAIDHPVMSVIGGAALLYGLYRGAKKLLGGEKKKKKHTGEGHEETHESEKGGFLSGIRTGMGRAVGDLFAKTAIIGGVLAGVYFWVPGVKPAVDKGIGLIKKMLNNTPAIPSPPSLPGAPGLPSGPNAAPTLPNSLTDPERDVRQKTIDSLIALRGNNLNQTLQINTLIGELTTGGGYLSALNQLNDPATSMANIPTSLRQEIEEILSRGMAQEAASKEAESAPSVTIDIELTNVQPSQVILHGLNLTEKSDLDKISDALKPSALGITANMEWGTNISNQLLQKFTTLKNVFTNACKDNPSAPAENIDKRAILEPLWRKMIYDVCMERVDRTLDSSNYTSPNTLGDEDKVYLKDLISKLGTNITSPQDFGSFFDYRGGDISQGQSLGPNKNLSRTLNGETYKRFYEMGSIVKQFNNF